jgi:hypothetical protein
MALLSLTGMPAVQLADAGLRRLFQRRAWPWILHLRIDRNGFSGIGALIGAILSGRPAIGPGPWPIDRRLPWVFGLSQSSASLLPASVAVYC